MESLIVPFERMLEGNAQYPLKADSIEIFQINMGKKCNQACRHCHVEAGPLREETAGLETLEICLDIIKKSAIPTVDITGGAPEMNPNFRWFVEETSKQGCHIIDRCNLTILLEPGYEDLAEFLKEHKVEIVSSLPFYTSQKVDGVRGRGVFQKSIDALKRLNRLGYGIPASGLILNLVYNPSGAFLPPPQHVIEADYRRELKDRFGISFNSLFTIANMPIGRFKDFLERTGNYESYLQKLISNFNPKAAAGVMCKYTLSVGWDGQLYDCDFNQMLNMNCDHGAPTHISEFDLQKLSARQIVTGLHCYGCTAGGGSSCGGAVVNE